MESDISQLVGVTIKAVEHTPDEIKFALSDGRVARFYHEQDCCEEVVVDEVAGDWNDLIGVPLLVAEERTSDESPRERSEDEFWDDSNTWTFYTFRTVNGTVDVRWHGSSNGYYSENVDLQIT